MTKATTQQMLVEVYIFDTDEHIWKKQPNQTIDRPAKWTGSMTVHHKDGTSTHYAEINPAYKATTKPPQHWLNKLQAINLHGKIDHDRW